MEHARPAAITPRAPERRLVHVLFADLVGFTPLVEALDAEDVALLQEHYFGLAQAAVVDAGGQVEKYIGDAVMATFGLPVLRPGDAERAVRAGQRIVAGLADVETALGLAAGTLTVRVGIHTGEVVVSWGPQPDAWRLSGDVVNTAARLQAAAEPGTVVVGPDTALAVAEAFGLHELGEVALKGKSTPVTAWRVGSVAGRSGSARRRRLVLHGRDDELAQLEAWHDAGAATTLVLAPPGVGRSRLVEECAVRLRDRGVPAWVTAVRPGRPGYAPVADLLRQALGWTEQGPPAEPARATVLARLAGHGHTGPRAELSAEHTLSLLAGATLTAAPLDLWASWTAVLDADGAPGGPAPVWVIDDLHLATPDLLGWLEHATEHPHRPSRWVLGTARPGDTGLPAHAGSVLTLGPLPDDAVVALISSEVRAGTLAPEVVSEIARAAGGNPLFVAELLRSWRRAGLLEASAGHRPEMPSTVRAIYLGQLDALAGASRELLETGSVAGTTLPARALPELGIVDPDPALLDLTGSGLLAGPHDDPVDPLSYTYRHALLREAAYATLPRARRASLHLRFARWLEAGSVRRQAERIGMHLAAAWEEAPALGGPVDGPLGTPVARTELAERAAGWLTEAGDAVIDAEPLHAAALFRRARDLSGTGPSSAAAHRQLRMGEALRRAGRLTEAMEAFAAVPDADGPGGHRTRAAAALGFEDALFDSRLPRQRWNPRALALVDGALAATPSDEPALRSRLLAAGARAEAYHGRTDAAAHAADRARALAEAAGDPGALAYALLARRPLLAGPEQLDERLRLDDAMLAAATRAGDVEREFEALRLGFADRLEAGDVDEAERRRARAEEIAAGLGAASLWYPPMWRVMTTLLAGDLDAAAGCVEDFRRQGERWHYRDAAQVHAVQLLALHTELGTPELALPALAEVAPASGPRFAANLGVALARAGRLDEARTHLDALRPGRFAVIPHDGARALLLGHAAEIADAVADADAGAVLAELLAPWRERVVVVGAGALCPGAAAHALGLAARAAGHRQAAVSHLERAVTMNEALRAPRLAARSRAELARTR